MSQFWLLRLKHLALNRPSPNMLKLVAVIVIACFALYFFEQTYGWPEWLTVDKGLR